MYCEFHPSRFPWLRANSKVMTRRHGHQAKEIESAWPSVAEVGAHDGRRQRHANDPQGQVDVENGAPTERICQVPPSVGPRMGPKVHPSE